MRPPPLCPTFLLRSTGTFGGSPAFLASSFFFRYAGTSLFLPAPFPLKRKFLSQCDFFPAGETCFPPPPVLRFKTFSLLLSDRCPSILTAIRLYAKGTFSSLQTFFLAALRRPPPEGGDSLLLEHHTEDLLVCLNPLRAGAGRVPFFTRLLSEEHVLFLAKTGDGLFAGIASLSGRLYPPPDPTYFLVSSKDTDVEFLVLANSAPGSLPFFRPTYNISAPTKEPRF